MRSEAFVQLALDTLSCTQKELAANLGVSPTQVSKWKKGDHLSWDMEAKLRAIANIGDEDPEFVLWAGSLEEAIKWKRLIQYLAERAKDNDETGYRTHPLEDEMGLLCSETFHVLREAGVTLPKTFPQELDMDYEETDIEELSELLE